jgi:hypothetical protein
MAAWAANNSRSKVEQRDSVSVSLREQKPSGRQWSPDFLLHDPSVMGIGGFNG